jgi:hypothetical protein
MDRSWGMLDLLALAILAIPFLLFSKVVRRAGYSPWWVLLGLVPVVNFVVLWVFAYARWPALDAPPDGR